MSKKKLLEQINIKEPCSESWDEMTGNDKVRFCGHCNLNVNNFSAMNRREALKIVKKADGRICVRYMQNPVNKKKPVFGDKIYQITRRAGITAGVLGASLTLSTLTYGQVLTPTVDEPDAAVEVMQNNPKIDENEIPTAEILGTLTDSEGVFAFAVTVRLFNLATGENFEAMSDNDGVYKFESVRQGNYKIIVDDEKGSAEVSYLEISDASENRQDIALTKIEFEEVVNVERSGQTAVFSGGAIAVAIEFYNPLTTAVWDENETAVKNLIIKNADVNVREHHHENITPLFLAVENGSFQITEMLLNFGADVNAADDLGRTPLMRIDDDADVELVRLLVKYGANINAVDREGNSALILAASDYVEAEVLQELLKNGANVNVQNKDGKTALMEASYEDDFDNVKTLILSGADVNLKNADGETALDLTSDEEIRTFFKSYGATKKPE